MHPFNALAKTFKWLAYPFKKKKAICLKFHGKLWTVCLSFCYGQFEVSILRSLDTRRFLKYRKTVSYFGFIFCVIIVSEFPSHPLTNKLSWNIRVGIFRRPPVDGLLNRLLSFCLYHLDSSFLVLLTIILTAPLGAWHWFDLLFAMELHCVIWPWNVSASDKVVALHMQLCFTKLPKKQEKMKFIFNKNKNKQRRRLRVSHKLFSVNCAYFMNVTAKRQ